MRILVIWYKTCWIIQDDLISRSLIISAKVYFLNKITFIDIQGYSIAFGGGFPGGTGGKEPACQCRRWKSCMFNSWVRKRPCGRAWQPTPVFLPGESPWTEEPGRLKSMGLHWVRYDWSDLARMHTYFWGGRGTPNGTRQPYFPLASPEHGWLDQEEVPEPNRGGLFLRCLWLAAWTWPGSYSLPPTWTEKQPEEELAAGRTEAKKMQRLMPKVLALWPWGQAKLKK